jgi:hypothetical protein
LAFLGLTIGLASWTLNMDSIQYMKCGKISCTPRLQASVVVAEVAHLVVLASMDNLILNTWEIYIGPTCTFIWTTYYHTYVLCFPLAMRTASLVLHGDS